MRVSSKAHYGLRMMTEFAKAYGAGPLSIAEVARVEHLPLAYLEQLASQLRRGGLVESTRGVHGGYSLTRPAAQISVLDVVTVIEGEVSPVECVAHGYVTGTCQREGECASRGLWMRLKQSIDAVLSQTTLAELVADQSLIELDGPGFRGTLHMSQAVLSISGLRATVEGKEILKGVDLQVAQGEIHALMGPNGSGKSTLAYTLMGHPKYAVTGGSVTFGGVDLLPLTADARARLGLFLCFQYPTAIPGVSTVNFLRAALRAQEKEMPAREFLNQLGAEMKELKIDESFRSRYINDGFSGGEKKRMEILQLAMLRPKLAILDETDSGLDVDALRTVADGVMRLCGPDMGVLVITHYPRILEHLHPDRVHVLHDGRVVTSGGADLAQQIEREGYEPILGTAAAATA